MSKRGKIIILILFNLHSAEAAQSLDEALCGKKSSLNEESSSEALHLIEKNMPPIHDQSETNWCYAFAACDLINYNIHLVEQQQNPAARYLAEHEVSIIDAIDQEQSWLEKNKNPALRKKQNINLARRGDAMNILQALQASAKVRTQAQVPFHSAQAADDGAARIDEILRGKAASANLGKQCASPSLLNQGFYKISRALATQAAKEQHLKNGATLIENYSEISSALGPPGLAVPFLTPHSATFHSAEKYLAQIKTILASGQPVVLGVCGNPLPGHQKGCDSHELTAVGAAYVEGVCSIRLRNSWGTNWKDQGYITLPVEELLNLFQNQAYPLTWVDTK